MEMSNITARIRDQITSFETKEQIEEIGEVSFIGDGIARVIGLTNVMAGELVEFENGAYGMAQNLEKNDVGVIIFGGYENIHEGEPVKRTGRILDVPVGDALIGRVVDALGRPIDGLGAIETTKKRPVENEAPGVMQRQSVKQSLPTGLKVVDALVPIGKGQRELIIGDRQTGKTALAIDAIINQRDSGIKCIYVAICQKASTIANVVRKLEEHGALENTIVVAASASESAA